MVEWAPGHVAFIATGCLRSSSIDVDLDQEMA
jgi:hypothetical protein